MIEEQDQWKCYSQCDNLHVSFVIIPLVPMIWAEITHSYLDGGATVFLSLPPRVAQIHAGKPKKYRIPRHIEKLGTPLCQIVLGCIIVVI
jgi:hypothetical protein